MKSIFPLVLSGLVLLSLPSCKGCNESTDSTNDGHDTAAVAPPAVKPPGFNADTAQHSVEICRDPASLKLIRQIAREERSHAELSWRILQFCHRQSPQEVAEAVLAEMATLAATARPTATSSEHLPLVLQADPQALIDYGRLPDAQFDALWNARMQDTKQRLMLLLERVDEEESALAAV